MLSCDGLLVVMVQPAWLQESQPTSKLLCLLLPLFNRYHLPLAELGGDFYDELKSISSGYASFDYEEAEYRWAVQAHFLSFESCCCCNVTWQRLRVVRLRRGRVQVGTQLAEACTGLASSILALHSAPRCPS